MKKLIASVSILVISSVTFAFDNIHCSVVKEGKIIYDGCTFTADSNTCTYKDIALEAVDGYSKVRVAFSGKIYEIQAQEYGYAELETMIEVAPGISVRCGNSAKLNR